MNLRKAHDEMEPERHPVIGILMIQKKEKQNEDKNGMKKKKKKNR